MKLCYNAVLSYLPMCACACSDASLMSTVCRRLSLCIKFCKRKTILLVTKFFFVIECRSFTAAADGIG